jgi:hypothetical protein
MSRSYAKTDSGFYSTLDEYYEQPGIAGEIVFTHEPYTAFRTLVDFVATAKALKLVYRPQTVEYYMDICIDVIEKTELEKNRTLVCPVSFSGLTPWYRKNPVLFEFAPAGETNTMRLPFRFPFVFAQGVSNTAKDISATGHFPAEVVFEGMGPLLSPSLTLKNKYTEEVYGKITLDNVVIDSGEKLMFSTRTNDIGVTLLSNGIVTDLIDKIDLTQNTFFKVPVNTPCEIILTLENTLSGSCSLFLYEYYMAV